MFFAVDCVKVLTELAEVNQLSLNLLSWRFPVQILQAGLDIYPLKAACVKHPQSRCFFIL